MTHDGFYWLFYIKFEAWNFYFDMFTVYISICSCSTFVDLVSFGLIKTFYRYVAVT
jgi:hypothetical protein